MFKGLIDRCWAHIDKNVYEVIAGENLVKIDRKLLDALLARDTLKMSKMPEGEIALWEAVIWNYYECHLDGNGDFVSSSYLCILRENLKIVDKKDEIS